MSGKLRETETINFDNGERTMEIHKEFSRNVGLEDDPEGSGFLFMYNLKGLAGTLGLKPTPNVNNPMDLLVSVQGAKHAQLFADLCKMIAADIEARIESEGL